MFTEAYYVCSLRRFMYVLRGVLCVFTEAYYVCLPRRFIYVH